MKSVSSVDSGSEWIGQIPNEWNIVPLKSMFTLSKGLSITKEDLVEDGAPVISYGQVHSKTNSGVGVDDGLIKYVSDTYLQSNSECLVYKGGFIFADTSEDLEGCGNCAYIDTDYPIFAGYHTIILRSRSANNNKYFAYLFKTDAWRTQIRSVLTEVKVFSISQKVLKEVWLIVPPENEQKVITEYLDGRCAVIDEAIKRSKVIIYKLIEYRKSVITHAVTKWGVTTKGTQKTHIPEFPIVANGFTLQRIKFLLSSEQNNLKVGPFGSALPSRYFVSEGIWVYNQRTVLDNNFETNDTCISPETYNALKGFEVYPGDIILTTRGTIGKAAIVPPKTPLGILHPCLIRFRVNEQIILREYVLCILNDTSIVLDQIKRKSGATTIEALYSYALKDVTIPVPPIREQKQILSFVKSKRAEIDDAISRQQTIIEKLEEYKKSLIYNAVTGKIDCRKET